MRRFEVDGFDAARYVSEHNDGGSDQDDDELANYAMYSRRSLESEPAFEAHSASRPVGYVEPSYGQASAYQRQPPLASAPGARPIAKRPPDSVLYYFDPATQTYVATTAPPPSLSASMQMSASTRMMKKIILPPGQVPRPAPAAAPAGAAPPAPPSILATSQALPAVPQPAPVQPTTLAGYAPPVNRHEVAEWSGPNKWVVSVGSACCKAPCACLGACFCPCCMLGSQRGRLLGKDWKNYRCCAGLCGQRECCSDDHGRCGVCCEAVFCCPCALHGNRFILQKRYNLERSCCDRCVASCACSCNDSESCCGWCGGGLCDIWYMCAFPCLLTQQHCQIKAATSPPSMVTMML